MLSAEIKSKILDRLKVATNYTERVLAKRPLIAPIKKNKPSKKKPKPAERVNYDIFDLNKKVVSVLDLPKKKEISLTNIGDLPRLKPEYIGQNIYIRPSYVVTLPEYHGSGSYTSQAFLDNMVNLMDNQHGGEISQKADKKLRNAVNWLLCSADEKKVYHKKKNSWFKFRVNFITLTLPDTSEVIDNKKLQKLLLNPFFTYMRKYCGLNNYVWKLEFQKNGKLHVHFASDTFIHHAKIRSCWNKLLGSNGFLAEFYMKFGHANPNSTDVHSVRKIKNLAAYIAKYMSKQSADLKKIKGRIWGCSKAISEANAAKIFIDRDQCITELKPLMSTDIEFKPLMRENKTTKISKRIGEIFFLSYSDWFLSMKGAIKEKFDETILMLKQALFTSDQLLTV